MGVSYVWVHRAFYTFPEHMCLFVVGSGRENLCRESVAEDYYYACVGSSYCTVCLLNVWKNCN